MKQSTAKTKATVLHSQLVRARGRCEGCGLTDPTRLQTAHIISRRYAWTRVRLDNAFCACQKCHMRWTEWPLEFAEFVERTIGDEKYEELRKAALETGGRKVDWVAELEWLQHVAQQEALS